MKCHLCQSDGVDDKAKNFGILVLGGESQGFMAVELLQTAGMGNN